MKFKFSMEKVSTKSAIASGLLTTTVVITGVSLCSLFTLPAGYYVAVGIVSMMIDIEVD